MNEETKREPLNEEEEGFVIGGMTPEGHYEAGDVFWCYNCGCEVVCTSSDDWAWAGPHLQHHLKYIG